MPSPVELRQIVNEVHQLGVGGEHEGRDGDPGFLAGGGGLQGLCEDLRIEPVGILVDLPVLRDCRGLPVRHHEDLPIGLAGALQDGLRHLQPRPGIGVERAHLEVGDIADGYLPRLVPEGPHAQGILGITGQDQLRKRQGHLLCRGDPVLSVEDHAVADVDEKHRCAGGQVLRLVDLQVLLRRGRSRPPRRASPHWRWSPARRSG